MNNIIKWISLMVILPLSWSLCGFVRQYTLRKKILDIPNERSSHTIPTPRGGGLAIVIAFLIFMISMFFTRQLPRHIFMALFGGGLFVAVAGWLDDRKIIVSSRFRLFVHFLATCWTLYWLHGFRQLNLGFTVLNLGFSGTILAAVGIVWVTNLYNFMDGIDGLAGTEAVCGGAFAGLFLLAAGLNGLAFLSFALAFASLGFLIWNWPKAKIFMGDIGSYFLGFMLASLTVASENSRGIPLFIWAILLGVFLVDATATLIRRICHKEQWYAAHRSHAYQYAVQTGYTHRQVTLAVLFINIALALCATFAWALSNFLLVFFCGVYGFLLALYAAICRSYRLRSIFAGNQFAVSKNELKE